MQILGDIVSEEAFINAYHLINNYYSENDNVIDVNLRLTRPYFEKINEKSVKQFYQLYIKNELIYSLSDLSSSEVVSIPKNMTGVREYRFLSVFSQILYNAVGIVFADCSIPLINSLDFNLRGVYTFFPTRYIYDNKSWKVKNDYRQEYSRFTKRIDQSTQIGDVAIQLDIQNYFDSIDHDRLIESLFDLSTISSLRSHNLRDDSKEVLSYYFANLMQANLGIPQGRKNFTSDYFGYFYLIPFDNQIRKLCKSDLLELKASVRYVDDTTLVFTPVESLSNAVINKELLRIEQSIASWLFDNLCLTINPSKTKRSIIENENDRRMFIQNASKSVSLNDEKKTILNNGKSVDFMDFIDTLKKFQFSEDSKFRTELLSKDERENLKFVFSKQFKKAVGKTKNRKVITKIIEDMDVELTVDEIYLLMPLFGSTNYQEFEKTFSRLLSSTSILLSDKRYIHIILVALCSLDIPKRLSNKIIKVAEELHDDNYAKYLPVLLGELPSFRKDEDIFRRICFEHLYSAKNFKSFILTADHYSSYIEKMAESKHLSPALIQALKNYQLERMYKRWDLAFNYLQSVFHETMKRHYRLDDSTTIQQIAKKLEFLDADQELMLRKFYDRRNFNPISHPSKKGTAAEKVSYNEFTEYNHAIMEILNICFDEWQLKKPTTPTHD